MKLCLIVSDHKTGTPFRFGGNARTCRLDSVQVHALDLLTAICSSDGHVLH